jgi:hypothetical protein
VNIDHEVEKFSMVKLSFVIMLFTLCLGACTTGTLQSEKARAAITENAVVNCDCIKEKKKETTLTVISEVESNTRVKRTDWLDQHFHGKEKYRDKFFVDGADVLDIPESDIYMVPLNQALPAIRRLRSNSVLELERSNERKAYAGRFYKPVNGTKAYLVRAIYENHTGNGFVAKWHRKEKILM